MTAEKLQEILQKHKAWLNDEPHGERANLSDADLSGADLRRANLRRANLSDADLSDADLSDANLRHANLSGAKELLSAVNYLDAHFKRTDAGYIVYKSFGGQYSPPASWKIEPDSVIEENVLFDRCQDCGCGINVASLAWVKKNYHGDVWKCLIEWPWLAGVCVPYSTDGKIRCERVRLLEIVN